MTIISGDIDVNNDVSVFFLFVNWLGDDRPIRHRMIIITMMIMLLLNSSRGKEESTNVIIIHLIQVKKV